MPIENVVYLAEYLLCYTCIKANVHANHGRISNCYLSYFL